MAEELLGQAEEKEIKIEKIETNLLNLLPIKDYLELNAKLQQKKNKARSLLVEMGVLEKKGQNDYDHYKYFTEAQYKEVANKILSKAGLELKPTEKEYFKYKEANSKTPVGRIVTMLFTLTDMETGFYEESIIRGEGLDRGDKAGYKAYTGAIKYYLANTFLIPTGDDPEKESPDTTGDTKTTKKTTQQRKQNVLVHKQELIDFCKKNGIDMNMIAKNYKLNATSKDEDFIAMAIDELVKMGIIESKEDVIDATRQKVKKAYPAYFGSYDHFDKVRAELDKIQNLYCIGRNGQHRYNNMDHSMLTLIKFRYCID